LREALAGANHDFLLRDDRRSGAKRPKAKPGKGWLGLLGRRRRSTVTVFLAFAAVAAIGVPLNALYLQDGHHPAPLFQSGSPVATAPPPPQRPAAAHEAKTPPVKTEVARKVERSRDQIKQLLDGGAAKKTAVAGKKIAAAQHMPAKPTHDPRPGGAKSKPIQKIVRNAGSPAKAGRTPQLAAPSGGARP
jgi:hypothetical protein